MFVTDLPFIPRRWKKHLMTPYEREVMALRKERYLRDKQRMEMSKVSLPRPTTIFAGIPENVYAGMLGLQRHLSVSRMYQSLVSRGL
jgi:hypothetical protein